MPARTAVTVGLGSAATASTADSAYAPLDRRGPELSVPARDLQGSLDCHGDFRRGTLQPVLLSPGTSATPKQNFSWNYERAFTAQGRPWCDVTLPHHTLGNIQMAGEYLVHSIRTMHAMTGRRIAVLVRYALVVDALDHPGPAEPERIPAIVCTQLYQPGVDPLNVENYLQTLQLLPALPGVLVPGFNLVGAPETAQEPPLRCYVFARGCRAR